MSYSGFQPNINNLPAIEEVEHDNEEHSDIHADLPAGIITLIKP